MYGTLSSVCAASAHLSNSLVCTLRVGSTLSWALVDISEVDVDALKVVCVISGLRSISARLVVREDALKLVGVHCTRWQPGGVGGRTPNAAT